LGVCLNLGIHMALGLVLAVVFYLGIAAWTYYVRGLLAVLMENKRRRRTVLAVITVGFVLLFQLPNLATQIYLRRAKPASQIQTGPWDMGRTPAARSGSETPATDTPDGAVTSAVVHANAVIPFG